MIHQNTSGAALLSIQGLSVSFRAASGFVDVLHDVSFSVNRGQTISIVGESGCGKSVTALSILRLLPRRTARINSGNIFFEGHDLLSLSDREMKAVRGNRIAMIFQEPMTSLNPVLTIGRQIQEVLQRHKNLSKAAAQKQTLKILDRVRIPDAARRFDEFPHQISGGMRQRVMIAMGLVCGPSVLIADEPTTALDVTIQAQILTLLAELRGEFDTAVILITHDLGVVAELAERVIVMYAGRCVEEAATVDLFEQPRHPYTVALLASGPRLSQGSQTRTERLVEIPGMVPSPANPIPGCVFAPRCSFALPRCSELHPPMTVNEEDHSFACWNPVPPGEGI
jgi:peptide/nickel transport system ATP-binding protein